MQTDSIKLWFSYALASFIIIAGGAALFYARSEGNSDFSLLFAGFIGAAITFVFNRESATQATRAASQATAAALAPNVEPVP
jgi:class 3 adenylate cyclase